MEEYRKALISNKEDTSYLLDFFGDEIEKLANQINELQKKQDKMFKVGNVMILSSAVGMSVFGTYYALKYKDYCCIEMTGICFCACELVWNGGHFIFKWW